MWKEPRKMDLGKHICCVVLGYSTWRLNQIKDLVLPPINDMAQSTCLLLKKMPIEAEILILEIETERKATNLKI